MSIGYTNVGLVREVPILQRSLANTRTDLESLGCTNETKKFGRAVDTELARVKARWVTRDNRCRASLSGGFVEDGILVVLESSLKSVGQD